MRHAAIAQSARAATLRHYGLDKRANLGLLGTGLAALASHGGTNALGIEAHHGSNISEILAHRGFQHGLLGQEIPWSRQQSMKSMFGPEVMIPYVAARNAGATAVKQYPSPTERNYALQHLHAHGHLGDGIPVAQDVIKAVGHELQGTEPALSATGRVAKVHAGLLNSLSSQTRTGFETGPQRALQAAWGAAPLAAAAGVDSAIFGGAPVSAGVHVAMNAVRQGVGASPLGPWFAKREFKKGLRGEVDSPRLSSLKQYALSPAIQDAQIAGNVVRNRVQAYSPSAASTLASPVVQEVADTTATQLLKRPGVPPPIPGYTDAASAGRFVRDKLAPHPGATSFVNHPVVTDLATKLLHEHAAKARIPTSITQNTLDAFKTGLKPKALL